MAMTFEEMAAGLDPDTLAWIERRSKAQANLESELIETLNKHTRLLFEANQHQTHTTQVVKDITDVIASIAISFLDLTAPSGYDQAQVYQDAANIMAAACISVGRARMHHDARETRQ